MEDSGFGNLNEISGQWLLEWLTMANLSVHDLSVRHLAARGVLPCVAWHLPTEGLASRSSALQDKVQTDRDGKSANDSDFFKTPWRKCSKLVVLC